MAEEATLTKSPQRLAAVAIAVSLLLSSCLIETPPIETTNQGETVPDDGGQVGVPTPATQPEFEPTVPPTPPPAPTEPPPPPTPEPTPAPTTEPTADPADDLPPPLPTAVPDDFEAFTIEPGTVAIPVADASFVLDLAHPVLQLGGHTLIYVDGAQDAEVDIFTPAARADGTPLASFDEVIEFIETNPAFADLTEQAPTTIAGLPTRIFDGVADSPDRAFVTDLLGPTNTGWFPPRRMRLWVIDQPGETVIVTAESLTDPGRFDEALALANAVLSTIVFG